MVNALTAEAKPMDAKSDVDADTQKLILAEYLANPYLPIGTGALQLGIRKHIGVQIIAQAALDGKYQAYGLLAGKDPRLRRKVFHFLAAGGTLAQCYRQFEVKETVLDTWLRPIEYLVQPPSFEDAGLAHAKTQEALVDAAVHSIERETRIRDSLAGRRLTLAKELYDKIPLFWQRAEELARQDDIKAMQLRAVVEAAHVALKDAQLLAGEATDRTESFLTQIAQMTTEELRSYVYGTPEPGILSGTATAPAIDPAADGPAALPAESGPAV